MASVIVQRELTCSPDQLNGQLHPVIRRIMAARGVRSDDELSYRLAGLARPDHLQGLDSAAAVIAEAIREQYRIVIVGDFDADGATASALAVRYLRQLGAQQVEYCVPNRFEHGYGLSAKLVELIEPAPNDLLITVDNGIASIEGVAAANQQGARVVITDHHLPGPTLPAAAAIVNPNLPGSQFASQALAGVGVIFYVMAAVRKTMSERQRSGNVPALANVLDLVALGTVADLVALDYNNRILISQGLQRIRAGQACPGIHQLLMVAGKDPRHVSAGDLAFAVAPRLNAAGRLDDISLGIECLLTDDSNQAADYAAELDRLNRERKLLQEEMCDEADRIISTMTLQGEQLEKQVITVFHPEWHQGVVGLVASRLKEQYHRPVIAFAPASPGSQELKGSARSVEGFHIRDALAAVDAANPGLIDRFGGHAMAAGLSITQGRLNAFSEATAIYAAEHLHEELVSNRILTDGELSAADLDLPLATAIQDWGPWGQKFPEPLFDGHFQVLEHRLVGGGHLKMTVRHPDGHAPVDAIAFGFGAEDLPQQDRVRLIYHLQVNRFRGRQRPQLLVRHIG